MHHVFIIGGFGSLATVCRRSYALVLKLCQHISTECVYTLYVRRKPTSLKRGYCYFTTFHLISFLSLMRLNACRNLEVKW